MKQTILILALLFVAAAGYSQGIGRISINFRDATRSGGFSINGATSFPSGSTGRNIGTEIYYPATSNGTNTPIVAGDYPVIVFGHGFAMAWDAYQNIWEALVPQGYIVAFPRTEGGLLPAPSHNDFGLDLRLVETLIQEMGNTSGNILFGNVSPNGAIMGHSMGGGSTFLAASNNTSPTLRTVVGLAPAETNPSAISAAMSVTVDVLVLSGSNDGVTPPAQHHLPIYNAVNNDCKFFVSLIGGGHCRFANANFNCEFGESTSGGPGSLTRPQVHAITNNTIIPWFNFKLKGDCAGWSQFQNYLANESNVTVTDDCSHDVIPNVELSNLNDITVCVTTSVELSFEPINPAYTYQWFNENGEINGATTSPFSPDISGQYYVQAYSAFNCAANSSSIEVNFTEKTIPDFSQVAPICQNDLLENLPNTSLDNITGSWSPMMNNQTTSSYTFTPNPGQCAAPTTMTIVVNENPNVSINFENDQLNATPNFVSYSWAFNGETINGANTSTWSPTENGNYSVSIIDVNGCLGTASFNFNGANLDGLTFEYMLFPNPSMGMFYLSFNDVQTRKIQVFDYAGILVFENECAELTHELSLVNLASGVYLLSITQAEKAVIVPVLIQH